MIEKYLSGELSAEEKKEFRSRLLNDPAFNQEFQELKEIRLQVRQNARKDVKILFDEIETSIESEETTKDQTVMKKVISIAASIILIAAISYVGLSDFSSATNQELFDKHFKAYNSLSGQVRGAMDNELSLEDRAFGAYDAGDYIASEEFLSELALKSPSAMNYFYLGVSQLEIGKTEEAVKSLNTVINNFSAFQEQAKWYLALTLLKEDNEEATLGSLANMIVNNSEYEEKARALLEEMGYKLEDTALDSGPVSGVNNRPKEDGLLSPDGSMENTIGMRKYQWGIVTSITDDKTYRFFTDQPISDLNDGDMTVFVIVEKVRNRGRGRGVDGSAFIIDKY